MADLAVNINTGTTFTITVNPAPNVYVTVSPGPSTAAIQAQIDALVDRGDSSVEAAQARVDATGTAWATLKARCDNDATKVRALTAGGTGSSTTAGARANLVLNEMTYTTVSQLGQTVGSATINGCYAAMPNGSALVAPVSDFDSSEIPTSKLDHVVIVRVLSIRACCEFYGKTSSDGRYYQALTATGTAFDGVWHKYRTSEDVIDTAHGGTGQTTVSGSLTALNIRRGTSQAFTASATAYTDQAVSFETAFGAGVTPYISITLLATGTGYATGGDVNWCVVTSSISNTGFTIRVWNNASSSFVAVFDYIAIAP